jgi:hypothetical protein
VSQKKRKPGRPKLPKGEAKSRTLPAVRFSDADMRLIESAAKSGNQTVSDWVRSKLLADLVG